MFSALLWSETGHAADWPQYRGPNRDGISAETGLLQQWPEGGPPLRWIYTNAGIGYSGPAVVGQRLYTIKAIMSLPQPTAFRALVQGYENECPCCRRSFLAAN
jgi:hypothetical protein